MKTIVCNPTRGIYPATSDYGAALEVQGAQRLLFVAGTMGGSAKGIAGKALLDLIWSNLRRILAGADMTVDNIVRLASDLTDASYAEANVPDRIAALGVRAIPTTAIVVQTLAKDWLVEIEVVAAA